MWVCLLFRYLESLICLLPMTSATLVCLLVFKTEARLQFLNIDRLRLGVSIIADRQFSRLPRRLNIII